MFCNGLGSPRTFVLKTMLEIGAQTVVKIEPIPDFFVLTIFPVCENQAENPNLKVTEI